MRAIFGQCEQSELAGLARYYYGLSQLPLQELTLARSPRLVGAPAESLSPLALSPSEKALMVQHAQALAGTGTSQTAPRYQLAILVDLNDGRASSDALALERFIKAAAAQGIQAEILPLGHRRLPEFDTWLRPRPAVGHSPSNLPAVPSSSRCRSSTAPVPSSPAATSSISTRLMVRAACPCPHHRRDPPRPPACGRTGAAPRSAADGEDPDGAQGRPRHGQR